jgi:hypothetical protein
LIRCPILDTPACRMPPSPPDVGVFRRRVVIIAEGAGRRKLL